MTVRDLIECAPYLRNIEIIIREKGNGQWIQGFRIGPDAKIYKNEFCAEFKEIMSIDRQDYKLKEGESYDISRFYQKMPMKVICVDPRRTPENILELNVCDYLPRWISLYHGDLATHNDFDLEINCYPPEQPMKISVRKEVDTINEDDQLAGQMSIEDFLGE